jgi:hypothetical protein
MGGRLEPRGLRRRLRAFPSPGVVACLSAIALLATVWLVTRLGDDWSYSNFKAVRPYELGTEDGVLVVQVWRDVPLQTQRDDRWRLYSETLELGIWYSGSYYPPGGFSLEGAFYQVRVPLWLLILLAAVWPARRLYMLTRAERRKRHEPQCEHCGYNLTGNMSSVCPECGAACERVPAQPRALGKC